MCGSSQNVGKFLRCIQQVGRTRNCSATTAATRRTDLTLGNSCLKTSMPSFVPTSFSHSLTSSRAPSSRRAAGMTWKTDKTQVCYYIRRGGYVFVVVCLSVFLLVTLRKNFRTRGVATFSALGGTSNDMGRL